MAQNKKDNKTNKKPDEKKGNEPSPKDLYAEAKFMSAWISQLVGKGISELIHRGMATEKAREITGYVSKYVEKEGALDQGIMLAVAGLQTGLRTYAPQTGMPPTVADIIASALGEVDNALRDAKTTGGGILTQQGAAEAQEKIITKLKKDLEKVLTHEEAKLFLDLDEKADLERRVNEFKAQPENVELWENTKARLNSPLELRLLLRIPQQEWKSSLEQKRKQGGGVSKTLQGLAQFLPEGVRNALTEETAKDVRRKGAEFASDMERGGKKAERTARALGTILRRK